MMIVNTICLCGSTRFLDDYHAANIELTRRGFSVITISQAMPRQPDGSHEENGLKRMLDLVHLNKILRADAIFIVGRDYIGQSTAGEIIWATMQGKPIFWQQMFYYDTEVVNWEIAATTMRHPVHVDGQGGITQARKVLGLV
jgi:hypothetical protein